MDYEWEWFNPDFSLKVLTIRYILYIERIWKLSSPGKSYTAGKGWKEKKVKGSHLKIDGHDYRGDGYPSRRSEGPN